MCFFPTKLNSSDFALNYVKQKREVSYVHYYTYLLFFFVCFLIEIKKKIIRRMYIENTISEQAGFFLLIKQCLKLGLCDHLNQPYHAWV